ncbi:hypothetical protein H5410_045187, partial [Solanum commersonii]
MFKSFFSIGTPASIHLGVVSGIRGSRHPFRSSRVVAIAKLGMVLNPSTFNRLSNRIGGPYTSGAGTMVCAGADTISPVRG